MICRPVWSSGWAPCAQNIAIGHLSFRLFRKEAVFCALRSGLSPERRAPAGGLWGVPLFCFCLFSHNRSRASQRSSGEKPCCLLRHAIVLTTAWPLLQASVSTGGGYAQRLPVQGPSLRGVLPACSVLRWGLPTLRLDLEPKPLSLSLSIFPSPSPLLDSHCLSFSTLSLS